MKKKQPYEKFSGVTTNTTIYYHRVHKPDQPSRLLTKKEIKERWLEGYKEQNLTLDEYDLDSLSSNCNFEEMHALEAVAKAQRNLTASIKDEAFEIERLQVAKWILEESLKLKKAEDARVEALIGQGKFYPAHLKAWADQIERDHKYTSQLSTYLRRLGTEWEAINKGLNDKEERE